MKERVNTNPRILHYVFHRNNFFPNSHLPVIIYRKAIALPHFKNQASEIIQKIFAANSWSNSWRNGIYSFHHYHSVVHECMAVSMGTASVIFGGPGGKKIKLSQGDVIIIPAGVGHKCANASTDFLCVGAYPGGKDFDMNTGTPEEYQKALMRIHKLSIPAKDPVFGTQGFLKTYWKSSVK